MMNPAITVEQLEQLPEAHIGDDPAPGAEMSVTVPEGEVWSLRSLIVTLATDATVANRFVKFIIDDGAITVFRFEVAQVQVASLNRDYVLWPDLGVIESVFRGVMFYAAIPANLLLRPGWRIRTATSNIVAGDNFGAPVLYVVKHHI